MNVVDKSGVRMSSNGIMECDMTYKFDSEANNKKLKILNRKNYFQKSPIWDESDQTIFSKKYVEDDMFSVTINKTDDNPYGTTFTNLRYGTNVFHATIEFPTSYINDQYMVFFDSYDYG